MHTPPLASNCTRWQVHDPHELSGRVLVGSHLDASAHAGVMVNQRFKLIADSTADAPLTWNLEACSFGPFDLQARSSDSSASRSIARSAPSHSVPSRAKGRARFPNPCGRLVTALAGAPLAQRVCDRSASGPCVHVRLVSSRRRGWRFGGVGSWKALTDCVPRPTFARLRVYTPSCAL